MIRSSIIFLLLLAVYAVAWSAPTISSTVPSRNQGHIGNNATIKINFDQSMDNGTITTSTVKVYGSFRGLYTGSFSYGTNYGTFTPDSLFKPGEIIIVSVTTGVENAGSEALASPYVFMFTVDATAGYAKFKAPANYTAQSGGSGDYSSVIADLDGDGDLDIATTATLYDKLCVFMNNGDGTYASAVNYTTLSARKVVAADVDGDGDMDLLTANNSAHSLSVFLNSSGTFSTRNDYDFSPTQSNSGSLVALDMDGDGDIDVVESDATNNYIHVMKNDGSGAFSSTAYSTSAVLNPIAYADIDNDGDMDIVTINSGSTEVRMYTNDGTGALTVGSGYTVGSGPSAVTLADVNGGSKMDFIATNASSDNISVYTDGSGVPFFTSNTYSVGDYPVGVAAVDVDTDNDLDLLVANYNDATVSLLSNDGSGSFSTTHTYSVSSYPNGVVSADLDGDGDMDVVTSNNDGKISVLMNYNGGHVSSVSPANGALDITASSNIVLTFDENINSSTITSSTVKLVGSVSGTHAWTLSSYNTSTYVATIDPSNDFKPGEVVTVSVTTGVQNGDAIALEKGYSSMFIVEAGNTGGIFGSNTDYASGNQTQAVIFADLNADGDVDIASVNNSDGNVSVFINNGDGTYASAANYSVGTSPTSVAAGDVDGDGDLDLVVTLNSANQLARLLNNGIGVFGSATTYSTSAGPLAIALADIDGDGDLDAVYSRSSSQVMTQTNDGSGAFSNEWGWSSGNSGVTLADVDNDGDLDIVAAYNNGGISKVYVYANNGSGSYSSNSNYSVDTSPTGVVTGDFNGDGYTDIVTSNLSAFHGTISYLENNGNGTYAGKVDYTIGTNAQPRGLIAMDIDGDGDLDLVIVNGYADSAVVFTNNGSGAFTWAAQYATGDNPYAIASADYDGDGDLDIVTANYSGNNISVLKNTKQVQISSVSPTSNALDVTASSNVTITFNQSMNSGTLTTNTIKVYGSMHGEYSGSVGYDNGSHTATFNPTIDFKAGDNIFVLVKTGVQNGDGAGLANPYQWKFVVAASAEGTFGGKQNYSTINYPERVAVGDLDGDGDVDVVTVNGDSKDISVLLNNGSSTLGSADTTYTGASNSTNAIAIADLDGDGDLDVVTGNYNSTNASAISVLMNDGTANFVDPVLYTLSGNDYPSVAVADLNGDGYNDFVVTKYSSSQAVVFLNDGDGTFTAQSPLTTGGGPYGGLVLVDVDNDGDVDIVTADYDDGTVSVLKNNGDGTFAAKTSVSTGLTNPDFVSAGDLDGDGDADLAVSDWDNGNIAVLLNSGSGAYSSNATYTSDGTSQIELADMDGDGDLDIITNIPGDNKITIRTNNGSGSFSDADLFTVGNYPQSVALADMDGDGDIDIVVSNQSDKNVTILRNSELVKVSSISPTANAVNVDTTSNITATFNVAMNSATFVDSTVIVHGSLSGKISGNISYDGPSKTMTFNPTNDFLPDEEVSFTLTTDIKNSNGINLHKATTYSFRVHTSGSGNFVYRDTMVDYGYTRILASGDVNGDGKADLVGADYNNNRIKVFMNNSGTFDSLSVTSVTHPEVIAKADLDNDGDLDLMAINSGVNKITPLTNNGNGTFTAQNQFTITTSNANGLVLKDMDNDGRADAVVSWSSYQFIYIHYDDQKNYSYSASSTVSLGTTGLTKFACVDVDNDGDNDIVASYSSNVQVILNTGDRSFASPVSYTIGNGISSLEMADVNSDGYMDIVVGNDGGKSFSVMLNNGDGTFGTAVNYGLGFNVYQIVSGDIDGDGDIDLVVRGYDNDASVDKILIAYNNGSGVFGNQIDIDAKVDAPYGYYSFNNIELMDIDNDGDLDFAVQLENGSTQFIAFFENIAGSASAPTTAASNITTSSNHGTSITINWTNGDGTRRLVLVKQGGTVDATPSDNGNYSPNAHFSSGTQVGTGNYAVYGGSGSSVTVTGLSLNTQYTAKVYEMNGTPGNELFYTASAPTNTFTTSQFEGPFDATPGYALSYNGRWDQTNNSFALGDAFTVELWAKPSAIGSEMVMLVHGEDNMWIGIDATGKPFGMLYDDDASSDITITGTTTAVADQWYHLALTGATGAPLKLYVNGELEVTSGGNIGQVETSTDVFYPGGDYNNASYHGLIDELRLWSNVRTANEIRANMHKTLAGTQTNLVGYWQFNEGSGNSSAELVNNNTMKPYDEESDPFIWVTSDVPVGGGTSTNASVSANTTGSQTIGNVSLNLTNGFDDPTDVYVSEVSVAPNNYPTNYSASVGSKYFVIDAFPYPAPGSFSATLTLTFGSGVLSNTDPNTYVLYKRSSTSTSEWTSYGPASSVNTTTGEVTWNNISSFSQAMVVDSTANSTLPVELVSFAAVVQNGKAELSWATATEVDNYGFEIERREICSEQSAASIWLKIGFVSGAGTNNSPKEYSFTDSKLSAGRYAYRLKQVDANGLFKYSQSVEVVVSGVPKVFSLSQNYPNPFNPSTTIEFTLSEDGITTLKVFDILGREVSTLVKDELKAGMVHQATFDASRFSSGVYFYRLENGKQTQVKKLLLMK